VHPQNRTFFLPATATTGVHVEPKKSPLVTGGDRFPAWLVIKTKGLDLHSRDINIRGCVKRLGRERIDEGFSHRARSRGSSWTGTVGSASGAAHLEKPR
jgi:hypothetical protein